MSPPYPSLDPPSVNSCIALEDIKDAITSHYTLLSILDRLRELRSRMSDMLSHVLTISIVLIPNVHVFFWLSPFCLKNFVLAIKKKFFLLILKAPPHRDSNWKNQKFNTSICEAGFSCSFLHTGLRFPFFRVRSPYRWMGSAAMPHCSATCWRR